MTDFQSIVLKPSCANWKQALLRRNAMTLTTRCRSIRTRRGVWPESNLQGNVVPNIAKLEAGQMTDDKNSPRKLATACPVFQADAIGHRVNVREELSDLRGRLHKVEPFSKTGVRGSHFLASPLPYRRPHARVKN
jgi:hypothetical protein